MLPTDDIPAAALLARKIIYTYIHDGTWDIAGLTDAASAQGYKVGRDTCRAEALEAASGLVAIVEDRIAFLEKWNAGDLLEFSGLTEAKADWDKFVGESS